MNLGFIGASRFGLRCLELASQLPAIRVVGVVTAPQVFSISYRPAGVTNVLYADLAGYAKERGLPVCLLRQRMMEPGLLETVRAWKPDVFLVAGWYHMIPRPWRALAPAYGLHASLLPRYSGGAPLVWAMINGESVTGITLFQMDDGVDSGPIAGQVEEPIFADDTIATLYARIEERGLGLLRHVLPALAAGTATLIPQDEANRRIWRQRGPDDGRIDWQQDAAAIERFVRAQTRPYPGAFSTLAGERFTIWAGRHDTRSHSVTPGLLLVEGSRYYVACAHGRLELKDVTYENMSYDEFRLSRLFGAAGQRLGV